jgi:hypothetical protein
MTSPSSTERDGACVYVLMRREKIVGVYSSFARACDAKHDARERFGGEPHDFWLSAVIVDDPPELLGNPCEHS